MVALTIPEFISSSTRLPLSNKANNKGRMVTILPSSALHVAFLLGLMFLGEKTHQALPEIPKTEELIWVSMIEPPKPVDVATASTESGPILPPQLTTKAQAIIKQPNVTKATTPPEKEKTTKRTNPAKSQQVAKQEESTGMDSSILRSDDNNDAVIKDTSSTADHSDTAPEKKIAHQGSAAGIVSSPIFDAAYLQNPPPTYPASAKRRGLEGEVLLEVLVSKSGTAIEVTLHKTSGFSVLDEAAKEAVIAWQFIPAKQSEQPVEARVIVPVQFKLI
ncbi:MAG: TonB family protein [Alphaproteobacteria bacterium]